MTHEALRGDQVGSRLGTDENDEEFDDENYKRLDPRSALGVVAERVSCRVAPRASATQCCARRYVLGGDTFEVDGGKRPQESNLQGADIKRRRLGSKAGNCHDDDRRHHREKHMRWGPILACIHTPASTRIGTRLSGKDCAAGENKITPDKFFRKDVFAWLPELIFPNFQQPMCLTCGECRLTSHASYDFREVIALEATYFVFSGRVKCTSCERNAREINRQVASAATDREKQELKKASPQYTFHTTDLEYIKSLPYEQGEFSLYNRLNAHKSGSMVYS